MPSHSKIGDADFDPYDLLGIKQGTSDAAITKAYRKLALQLHPDKQGHLSESQKEQIAVKFHSLQEARNFLLDTEHAEARRIFDAKRASQTLRKQQDAQRDQHISDRRKRMRDDLHKQEQALRNNADANQTHSKLNNSKREEDRLLEKLRKQGQKMRQRHADQAAAEDQAQHDRTQHKKRMGVLLDLAERQVRLKWSRTRISISPSEHTLATQLETFGPVDKVELIGSKGNAALVTFKHASSCGLCVNAYKDSTEMRATFAGTTKHEVVEEKALRKESTPPSSTLTPPWAREEVSDRKIRQAAERERLLQQIQLKDAGYNATSSTSEQADRPRRNARAFPAEFPITDDYHGLTPFQKLNYFERVVFQGTISNDLLQ